MMLADCYAHRVTPYAARDVHRAMAGVRGNAKECGFSLLEIVMVLLITGYLLRSVLVPFGAHYQQQQRKTTEQRLHRVIDAVIGFAAANGRLPCPAGEGTGGWERPDCSGALASGYVPSATLGLHGSTNDEGFLLDGWHRPIRYHVSAFDHPQHGTVGLPDFTSANELNFVGSRYWQSEIEICRQVTAGRCPRRHLWANEVPLVLVSFGQNVSTSGYQVENQDDDVVYLHREFSEVRSDPFDDVVFWISENKLIYELLRAGVLP